MTRYIDSRLPLFPLSQRDCPVFVHYYLALEDRTTALQKWRRLLSWPRFVSSLSLFSLLSFHRNTDRQERSLKSTRKAVSRSLAIGTSLRGQRASSSRAGWPLLRGSQGEIPEMVRKFSIPIHEWQLALGSCVYHLENRVCSGVPADVG